jgi:polyribonucleotide nucleotidyltransferase
MILKDKKRPDGRDVKQIRKLSAEVDCLPRVHGSALFQRGQTQVMTITTLGSLSEAQRLDGIDDLRQGSVTCIIIISHLLCRRDKTKQRTRTS